MLKAAASRAETIRALCDDTDVFVLLVYWAWRKRIQKNIQMEKWDGTVLDINATVDKLGDKCGQLLGMHALSRCGTVSYPCGILPRAIRSEECQVPQCCKVQPVSEDEETTTSEEAATNRLQPEAACSHGPSADDVVEGSRPERFTSRGS